MAIRYGVDTAAVMSEWQKKWEDVRRREGERASSILPCKQGKEGGETEQVGKQDGRFAVTTSSCMLTKKQAGF